MPFQLSRVEHFVVVHWSRPSAEDVAALRREVATIRSAGTTPLDFVSVHSADAALPEPRVRAALIRSIPELLAANETLHIVLVGQGVQATLKRTVLRTMMTLMRRGDMVIYDSCAALLAALRARHVPAAIARALEQAINSG
jgi:hypothetical protein